MERCTLFLGNTLLHDGMYFLNQLQAPRSLRFIFFLYLSAHILPVSLARAHDLCTCNQLTCDNPVNCSYGEVLDPCGCCMVCARGKGESCGGGRSRRGGVCAKGLQCVINAKPGDLVTGDEQGTCQEISPKCDASACDFIITHRCPSDSVLVYNSTQAENACCKTTYECRCDMSVCKEPRCTAGHTPQIIRPSNKRPGSCCDLYHCKVSGCWSEQGKVYKNGETWKEGDCVTCRCVNGKKQCQAEMCMKTCLSPKYVPGRCCPICDTPTLYPNQSSNKCASLSKCNITCQTGLQQTPDGCHICKCKPEGCFKDCSYGYISDELGKETCQCHISPPDCPALHTCSKHCSHGFKLSKKGCPKCRCHKCPTLTCEKQCYHGLQRDRHGCKVCKCQEALWEKNCTMNMTEFTPGQSWLDGNCNRCMCKRDGTVVCEPRTCPQLSCAFMVKKDGECCPVCLNITISQFFTPETRRKTAKTVQVSANTDSVDVKNIEEKYIISLSIVGSFVMILLILVFVLLYLKLKQRHQASWSVAGQDTYCKCPLFIGHSPTLQHKYNLNGEIPNKLSYDTVVVQKYDHPCIAVSLKSDSPDEQRKLFLTNEDRENGFVNKENCGNLQSHCLYKDWAAI